MREEQLLAYLKGACSGRKYRVSGAELERVLSISGTDLRKLVNRLRRRGVPIAVLFRTTRRTGFDGGSNF